jgi:hypothetical protein
MGSLHYGPHEVYDFDDRTLAHLKIAISTKLRRNESFLFNWSDGAGRRSIWLNGGIPLTFEFDEKDPPVLNSDWLTQLMSTSHRTGGMDLIPEPDARSVS